MSAKAVGPVLPGEYRLLKTDGVSPDETAVFQGNGAIDGDHRFADMQDSLTWLIPIQGPGQIHVGIEMANQFDVKYRLGSSAYQQGPCVSDGFAGTERRAWRHFSVAVPSGPLNLEIRATDYVVSDGYGPSVWNIELSHTQPQAIVFDYGWGSVDHRIAAAATQGVMNRRAAAPHIFMCHNRDTDGAWLERIRQADTSRAYVHMDYQEVIRDHLSVFQGQILYDQDDFSIPVAISLAGILDCVPSISQLNLPVIRDIRGTIHSNVDAMDYLSTHVLAQSNVSALAVLNPSKTQPIDYFVCKKMCVTWFNADDTERERFRVFLSAPHFAPMVDVMGYIENGSEVASHFSSQGAISLVSDFMPNLSFLQSLDTLALRTPSSPRHLAASPTKRYYALVVSDGDNLQFLWNSLYAMLEQGEMDGTLGTFPLSMTFSNRLLDMAPFVANCFYELAGRHGGIDFIMGPSGYGFLHPTRNPFHNEFVAKTSEAAYRMVTNCYVHWDEPNAVDAVQQTIGAYENTYITGVLCPTDQFGDENVNNVIAFPEIYRLFPDDVPAAAASAINGNPRRHGFIYVQWSQPTARIQQLVQMLAPDIELVTARELVGLRRTELGLASGYPPEPSHVRDWFLYDPR